jgi:alpha-amylase/alpha-mannosidase (GH57 family)
MPRILLCFVWHMHQPFYKDLLSGEYRLPWTRLHALKDYYGMVHVLKDFPEIHQTFNLVPSMMVQVAEYATGKAVDPFLKCALEPSENLTREQQDFILRYFFQANVERIIHRYPRYTELYNAWMAAHRIPDRARRFFDQQAFRDLQVLSQLAWFDEEFLDSDPEVRALAARGRDYSPADQALTGRKQLEILEKVLPVYREFAASGQIEISTTPYYHPILPLLCDSDIARAAHPNVPLPGRFHYPEDALCQLERARQYTRDEFGAYPQGLWPSEGSVSDEALGIAADVGFHWAATDNGVLARTLGQAAGPELTYRPYVWRQGGRELRMIFRDHFLSDLIGFVYARMGAHDAAGHFLARIRENCRPLLASGHDALVPVILDGENAWEYYDHNGRPFLRELYGMISRDPEMKALTVSEALSQVEARPLEGIFPGSWINANFDIWIGAEEDNRAWDYLLRARQTYEQAVNGEKASTISGEARRLAYEELMIAEGSDWCWWYGPEHDSANRPEFDRLFREHLANVYRALQLAPPEELSRPILHVESKDLHVPPTARIKPRIDGEVTSYFEWMGAGMYRADARSGAMHGKKFVIRELYYGSDGKNLYVRLDVDANAISQAREIEARVNLAPRREGGAPSRIRIRLDETTSPIAEAHLAGAAIPAATEAAFRKVLELRVALAALGVEPGGALRLEVSVWQSGLPMDAAPQQGWLDISTSEPTG